LIVGGEMGATILIEILNEDGTLLCSLPNLPDMRHEHTQDGRILCGGEVHPQNCIKFVGGNWIPFTNLTQKRAAHVSWHQGGKTILMGGHFSKNTTEVVSESGSVEGFHLKYNLSEACSIQFDEYVIITGGLYTYTTVSKYNSNGWVTDLPQLITGRRSHGCSHFYSNSNTLVYLVAGGIASDDSHLSSTEIFSDGSLNWSYAEDLPSQRHGLAGITLNNNIFMIGGKTESGSVSEILRLDKETMDWILVDNLNQSRYGHSVTILRKIEVEQYCV